MEAVALANEASFLRRLARPSRSESNRSFHNHRLSFVCRLRLHIHACTILSDFFPYRASNLRTTSSLGYRQQTATRSELAAPCS